EARFLILFFFSSRRRHTRLQGDWSSDVCSSDLSTRFGGAAARSRQGPGGPRRGGGGAGRTRRVHLGCRGQVRRIGRRVARGAVEIGRASCREREENAVVDVSRQNKRDEEERHFN